MSQSTRGQSHVELSLAQTQLSQPCLSWKEMVEAIAQEGHGAADRDEPIFRRVQAECFPEELSHLKAGKAVLRSSRLLTLSPELDPDEGII